MKFLEDVVQIIVEEILKQPYFIVGLMVVIGYVVLRKKWYEVFSGFIRAVVGYMILQVGSGGLSGVATPFLNGLKAMNGSLDKTIILDTYGTQTVIEGYVGKLASAVYIILLVAFILNIILVAFKKWTKMRAIFTTGHVQMQQAFLGFYLIFFAYGIAFDGTIPAYVYIVVGGILGLYWAVGGNLSLEPTQELTDGAGFSIAHQQMFGIALVNIIGNKVRKSGKSPRKLESLKLPGWLSIFNDSMVATTFIMTLFFGTIAVIIGVVNPQVTLADGVTKVGYWKSIMPTLDSISGYKQQVIFFVFKQICQFAVYLAILQLGVRTFVTELSNAFRGISEKLLPGAVPAVDCAVAYGFGSQNAVTFGFIAGALGQIVATVILLATGGFGLGILVVTMFVPIFFDNATLGVFSNAKLGIAGAAIVPFINGLMQIIFSAFLASWTGLDISKTGGSGAWMAMNDWLTVWPFLTAVIKYIPYAGAVVAAAILVAIPQLQYYFSHKPEDRDDYFLIVTDWDAYKEKHITPYLSDEKALA